MQGSDGSRSSLGSWRPEADIFDAVDTAWDHVTGLAIAAAAAAEQEPTMLLETVVKQVKICPGLTPICPGVNPIAPGPISFALGAIPSTLDSTPYALNAKPICSGFNFIYYGLQQQGKSRHVEMVCPKCCPMPAMEILLKHEQQSSCQLLW